MYPTLEKIKEIAQSGEYRRIPVCRELYSDRYTPVEVMRTLRTASRHCYLESIKYFKDKLPILGICLGHQSICEAFGGTVSYAKELMHGKQKEIRKVGRSRMFEGLPETFPAARYHSLAAIRDTLPEELVVTAESEDGEVMALEHKEYSIFGLQFHPESVMTPDGKTMIENFMKVIRDR